MEDALSAGGIGSVDFRRALAASAANQNISSMLMLLSREEAETRIEIHHARRSFEYRDYLKMREKEIHDLLDKIRNLLPDEA